MQPQRGPAAAHKAMRFGNKGILTVPIHRQTHASRASRWHAQGKFELPTILCEVQVAAAEQQCTAAALLWHSNDNGTMLTLSCC